jgi:hypothetical protein
MTPNCFASSRSEGSRSPVRSTSRSMRARSWRTTSSCARMRCTGWMSILACFRSQTLLPHSARGMP